MTDFLAAILSRARCAHNLPAFARIQISHILSRCAAAELYSADDLGLHPWSISTTFHVAAHLDTTTHPPTHTHIHTHTHTHTHMHTHTHTQTHTHTYTHTHTHTHTHIYILSLLLMLIMSIHMTKKQTQREEQKATVT